MPFYPLPGTKATRVTIDEEIDVLEKLVDGDRIEHWVSVLKMPHGDGLSEIVVATMGTPLAEVRDMLSVALQAAEDVVGKAQDTVTAPGAKGR